MADYTPVEVPCRLDPDHGNHFAYMRDELGGRAILEVFDLTGREGEVAGIYHAVFRALVDWDLHDAEGEKLPINQQTLDDLHVSQFNVLRPHAVEAIKKGNTPLPNGRGGRSPSTSSGNRSQRRSTKGSTSTAST